ncbi:MAG: hypothetical protein Q4G58_00965 [bacterium]|nr:hypothetical protein [bacterium]
MTFTIAKICEKMSEDLIDNCMKGFFNGVVDTIEETNRTNKQIKKAMEGENNELFKEYFEILVNTYCKELQKSNPHYSEKELRTEFDRYYDEYLCLGKSFPDNNQNKEALFKRYKIFVTGYTEKLSKSMTFADKRILDKQDEIIEVATDINSRILTSKEFEKISKEQSALINRLCEDIEIPFVDIANTFAEVRSYHSKYAFWGNVFNFDKSTEREQSFVLSFILRNIGRTVINEINIKNLNISFLKEYDDNPEGSYLILKAMQHINSEKCTINLLPNSEQKVHFVVKRQEENLNDDDDYEGFINGYADNPEYNYDRLFIEFDMNVVGKSKNEDYHFYMFLGRDNNVAPRTVIGNYSVEYVAMELLDDIK